MTTITRQQYTAAQKDLKAAETASIKAMREGNQTALDKASEDGAKALGIIANYKAQRPNRRNKMNTVKTRTELMKIFERIEKIPGYTVGGMKVEPNNYYPVKTGAVEPQQRSNALTPPDGIRVVSQLSGSITYEYDPDIWRCSLP